MKIALLLICALSAQAWTSPEDTTESASELEMLIEQLSKLIDSGSSSDTLSAPAPAKLGWEEVMIDLRAVLNKVDNDAPSGRSILEAIRRFKQARGHEQQRSTVHGTVNEKHQQTHRHHAQRAVRDSPPWFSESGDDDEDRDWTLEDDDEDRDWTLEDDDEGNDSALEDDDEGNDSTLEDEDEDRNVHSKGRRRIGMRLVDEDEEEDFDLSFDISRLSKSNTREKETSEGSPMSQQEVWEQEAMREAIAGSRGERDKRGEREEWGLQKQQKADTAVEPIRPKSVTELQGCGCKKTSWERIVQRVAKAIFNISASQSMNSTRYKLDHPQQVRKKNGCGCKGKNKSLREVTHREHKTQDKYDCNTTATFAPGTLVDVMLLDVGQKTSNQWMPAIVDAVSCDGKYTLRKPQSMIPVRAALATGIQVQHLRLHQQKAAKVTNEPRAPSPPSKWIGSCKRASNAESQTSPHNLTATGNMTGLQDEETVLLVEQVRIAELRLQAAKRALQDERNQKTHRTRVAEKAAAEQKAAADAQAAAEAKAAAKAKVAEIDEAIRQAKLQYQQLQELRDLTTMGIE
jgi:hypothetical protein